MNTETGNRTVIFDARTEIERVEKSAHARMDRQSSRLDALSVRIDALEQSRASDATVVNDHASRIETMADRIDAGFARIRVLRTDPITHPLPASPAPVEPTPAPETQEQTATRLLSDPEALVVVLMALSLRLTEDGRSRMRERLSQICALGTPVRSHSLRVFAAAIAAGSFAS